MDLAARHRFSAPPERVATAMVDPAFAPTLVEVPDVGSVEVVDSGRDDVGARWLATRLHYDGSLDPIAAKVLGSRNPSWVQIYRLDPSGTSGRLTIEPDHHGSLLTCSALVELIANGDGTVRTLTGELRVHVPLLGGRAEKSLAPAIVARIDAEAELLAAWLQSA